MESNSNVIKLPVYTTEQSLIKTKLQNGIGLNESDITVLAKDFIDYTKQGGDNLETYVNLKYPNLKIKDKVLSLMSEIISKSE